VEEVEVVSVGFEVVENLWLKLDLGLVGFMELVGDSVNVDGVVVVVEDLSSWVGLDFPYFGLNPTGFSVVNIVKGCLGNLLSLALSSLSSNPVGFRTEGFGLLRANFWKLRFKA